MQLAKLQNMKPESQTLNPTKLQLLKSCHSIFTKCDPYDSQPWSAWHVMANSQDEFEKLIEKNFFERYRNPNVALGKTEIGAVYALCDKLGIPWQM